MLMASISASIRGLTSLLYALPLGGSHRAGPTNSRRISKSCPVFFLCEGFFLNVEVVDKQKTWATKEVKLSFYLERLPKKFVMFLIAKIVRGRRLLHELEKQEKDEHLAADAAAAAQSSSQARKESSANGEDRAGDSSQFRPKRRYFCSFTSFQHL
ncbi:Protein CBG16721 [Caenorhabditis briggsae]|uniref:Protein CBG16721 n=1 Tax=Caenorhabditis briggsae TaxID=6238 RepID=A8XPP3_CAEBR|nr:Protein CBG16721 [Caenorhabditis briggsae]CAP34619.1 Protein CBG16721 [Caenorhabditis briggsae]